MFTFSITPSMIAKITVWTMEHVNTIGQSSFSCTENKYSNVWNNLLNELVVDLLESDARISIQKYIIFQIFGTIVWPMRNAVASFDRVYQIGGNKNETFKTGF